MLGSQDLDLPPEGVRPKPGDRDLSETGITRLYEAAAEITDDFAKQAEIVALCVIARLDHNDLRRRASIGGIVIDQPSRQPAHIIHHNRSTRGHAQ